MSTPDSNPHAREAAHLFLAMQTTEDRLCYVEIVAAFYVQLCLLKHDITQVATVLHWDVSAVEDAMVTSFRKHFPTLPLPNRHSDADCASH